MKITKEKPVLYRCLLKKTFSSIHKHTRWCRLAWDFYLLGCKLCSNCWIYFSASLSCFIYLLAMFRLSFSKYLSFKTPIWFLSFLIFFFLFVLHWSTMLSHLLPCWIATSKSCAFFPNLDQCHVLWREQEPERAQV